MIRTPPNPGTVHGRFRQSQCLEQVVTGHRASHAVALTSADGDRRGVVGRDLHGTKHLLNITIHQAGTVLLPSICKRRCSASYRHSLILTDPCMASQSIQTFWIRTRNVSGSKGHVRVHMPPGQPGRQAHSPSSAPQAFLCQCLEQHWKRRNSTRQRPNPSFPCGRVNGDFGSSPLPPAGWSEPGPSKTPPASLVSAELHLAPGRLPESCLCLIYG